MSVFVLLLMSEGFIRDTTNDDATGQSASSGEETMRQRVFFLYTLAVFWIIVLLVSCGPPAPSSSPEDPIDDGYEARTPKATGPTAFLHFCRWQDFGFTNNQLG